MAARGFHHGLAPAHAAPGMSPASVARPATACTGPRTGSLAGVALGAALRLALLVWLTHFLVSMGQGFAAGAPQTAYVAHLGVQVLIISAAFFLLTIAGLASSGIYWILGTQVLAGAAALFYNGNGNGAQTFGAWMVMSLLSAMLLVIAMAARVYLPRSYPGWFALAGSLAGLGICIERMTLANGTEDAGVLSRHLYTFFLLMAWQLFTQRRRPDSPQHLQSDFPDETGTRHEEVIAASAVSHERRRIAQDLHDGVASQIVSILSSLDHRTPEQQALGLALEQCLLDIKITVDGIESADQNIVQALGSLRYRMQRPLDKLGIRLVWEVEMSGALETVHGVEAQQVLRIAQECLSNVMRHAKASAVVVACRHLTEMDCMEFEVRDNGLGIAHATAAGATGKGLDNMRQRARLIGGELTISSKAGGGTCVRLTLPLDPELCAVPYESTGN